MLADLIGKLNSMANKDSSLTFDAASDSLEAISEAVSIASAINNAGHIQVFKKAVNAAANAGAVTLGTITNQSCMIESVVLKAVTASQVDLTSINIKGGSGGVVVFFSDVEGAVGNLDTVDEQISWTGAVELGVGKTLIANLTGVGATPVNLLVTVKYFSCTDGGYIS
jgi:hypothetical protein